MNSGDEILEHQNDGHVIALLAAQRQLYSDAKKWHLANGFAVIGIPVAVSLLPKTSAFVQVGSIAVAGILSRVFVGRAEARQAEGTRVQQLVDSILFDVRLPNTDHDEELAARRARDYIRRSGTQDLKDWFPDCIRGLEPGRAEYEC